MILPTPSRIPKTALLCLAPLSLQAATVSLDNDDFASQNSGTNPGTLSSFTVGNNTNRLLVVTIAGEYTRSVDSVSFGTQSLTEAITSADPGGGPSKSSIWYLLAPDVGTANITVNLGSTGSLNGYVIGATSFYNVAQSGPLDVASDAGGSSGPSSLSYTIPTDAVIIEGMETNDGGTARTAQSGQTDYFTVSDSGNGGYRASGAYEIVGPGDQSNNFGTMPGRFAYAGAVFAAVPEPSSTALGLLATVLLARRRR
ncbi:MAG: hypothetical protein ACQKBY_00355 [Verrucomicrobiales bacterium]